jgi:hypothetical protein
VECLIGRCIGDERFEARHEMCEPLVALDVWKKLGEVGIGNTAFRDISFLGFVIRYGMGY